jgi:hypothetical protein
MPDPAPTPAAAGCREDEPTHSLAAEYAAEALRLLHAARAAGYFQTPAGRSHLLMDPDLAEVRACAEFGQLCAELGSHIS